MPYYKSPEAAIHFLDSTEFEHFLPAGCVPITEEEANAIVASKAPVIDPAILLKDQVSQSVQQELDAFAKIRGYDGILSACTYATSSFPKFKQEGQYCIDVRDSTWAACYAILERVEANPTAPLPTLAQVMEELPDLTWN